ncbi:MAG: hypothetical protein QW323_01980 [Candidatus Bathyarchaeia archaeon]
MNDVDAKVMGNYYLPKGMRPSTLEERKQFYSSEFSLDMVKKWFSGWRGKIVFAVIIGRHTRIFPPSMRRTRQQQY